MSAYVVEAKRTAMGKSHKDAGFFKDLRADQMLAELLKYFAEKVLPPENIDDIYVGCVGQHLEQGKNIARLSALIANYPETIPGVTINRLCASSLQAFNFAAMAISSGSAQAILAGGVEHMLHVPMASCSDWHQELLNRYDFPFNNMGLTAENLAHIYKISRQEQDEFAVRSHQKAFKAQKEKVFEKEIVAIKVGENWISQDQGIRPESTIESLGNLKTVFKENGTVTAGNSSQLSDGASLTLVASESFCKNHGLKKKAKILGSAVVGLDPCKMGLGPVPAIQKLLKAQNLTIKDIDYFELNEAFASQSIACINELKIPYEKINPSGGAIALGHPLGCSGTRLISTLINDLDCYGGKFGVASMCVGHGQGVATLIERC